MEKLVSINRITTLLSRFVASVNGLNSISLYSINIISERVLAPILKELFGYTNLKVLNIPTQGIQQKSIDLGDPISRVAFQVTSNVTSKKIKDTLKLFHKEQLFQTYDTLFFYDLSIKKKIKPNDQYSQLTRDDIRFDPKVHVLDYTDIIKRVNELEDVAVVMRIENLLEQQFSDKLRNTLSLRFFDEHKSLPPPPLLIIGRAGIINRLHSKVTANKNILLLSGFGGTGKTSLLMEYVNTHVCQDYFQKVVWVTISGSEGSTLYDQNPILSAVIAEASKFLMLSGDTFESKVAKTIEYFSCQKGDNLLVIDNVNNLSTIINCQSELLRLRWRIIIGTRAQTLEYKTFLLPNLSLRYAKQLFRNYCNRPFSEKLIESLIKVVNYHPLLIGLISKTLQQNQFVSIDKSIELAEKSNFKDPVFSRPVKIDQPQDLSVKAFENRVSTFLLELFPLTNLSVSETHLLSFFSLLLPKPYSFDWIREFYFDSQKNPISEDFLKTELLSLYAKGLLIKSEDKFDTNIFFSCHSIVQYTAYSKFTPRTSDHSCFLEKMAREVSFSHFKDPVIQSDYLSLLENIESKIDEKNEVLMGIKEGVRFAYWTMGNYPKALEKALSNSKIAEELLPADSDALAENYCNVAISFERLNRFDDALKFNKKAIRIRESHEPLESQKLAETYNNTAQVYRQLEDYENAKLLDGKAIKIKRGILGTDHPSLAISYCNHGITLYKVGEYLLSKDFIQKAIEIRENKFPPFHSEIGTAYYHMAIVLFYLTDYITAKEYIDRTISIWKACYSKDHPYLAFAQHWHDKIISEL